MRVWPTALSNIYIVSGPRQEQGFLLTRLTYKESSHYTAGRNASSCKERPENVERTKTRTVNRYTQLTDRCGRVDVFYNIV